MSEGSDGVVSEGDDPYLLCRYLIETCKIESSWSARPISNASSSRIHP